ncbi:hypothetical protein [Sporomusa acidovorans]|nr:hypothetical protein [Sporomusa acidovorans]
MTDKHTDDRPASEDLLARQDTDHEIAPENVAKEPDSLPSEMLNVGFPS